MRDAEEVARSIERAADAAASEGSTIGDTYDVAALLTEWQAEVRAATLAEFEVETDDDCFCAVACESYTIHVRLVGPWEPES